MQNQYWIFCFASLLPRTTVLRSKVFGTHASTTIASGEIATTWLLTCTNVVSRAYSDLKFFHAQQDEIPLDVRQRAARFIQEPDQLFSRQGLRELESTP